MARAGARCRSANRESLRASRHRSRRAEIILPILENRLARGEQRLQPAVGIRPRYGAAREAEALPGVLFGSPSTEQRVDCMRKLALTACLAALVAATPALADGRGQGGPSADSSRHSQVSNDFRESLIRVIRVAWRSEAFQPPGFSSPGRHKGWFFGKHWGWFKPHNPRWPHQPPVSP